MSAADLVPVVVQHEGAAWPLWRRRGELEPLALDLDVARWLEYQDIHKIRQLIARYRPDLGRVSAMVAETSSKGGRPGRGYYLTEPQALFLAAKSETPRATAVLKTLIAVFLQARRQAGGGAQLPLFGEAGALAAELAALRAEVAGLRADLRGPVAPSPRPEPAAQVPARTLALWGEVLQGWRELLAEVEAPELTIRAALDASHAQRRRLHAALVELLGPFKWRQVAYLFRTLRRYPAGALRLERRGRGKMGMAWGVVEASGEELAALPGRMGRA